MKLTDKAFWLTVIPLVLVWNALRPVLLRPFMPETSDPDFGQASYMAANLVLAGVLSSIAGYIGAQLASPAHLRAAGNVAVGAAIVIGLQSFIDLRGGGYPTWYFIAMPAVAAASALLGGLLRSLRRSTDEGA